jgi:rifampicin phosphotransferase
MRSVVPLRDVTRKRAGEFGGKAALLGEMLAAGIPALDGIAISSESYRGALRRAGVADRAAEFWDAHDSLNDEQLRVLGCQIAEGLSQADMSELADAVLTHFTDGGAPAPCLIVRSSATAEDSERRSYAGQFVSVPCPPQREALGRAIAEVWASCVAPHVHAYRSAFTGRSTVADDPAVIDMAVVVQPYQEFDLSGLLFSQHPTVALRDWMLIEYLDEQPTRLVAGEVLPHRCRVSRATMRVLWERRIDGRPVLTRTQLERLVEGGRRLAGLIGGDVDVEWGVRGASPIFLQCRPATVSPSRRAAA